jgi:hypothetical protein
MGSAPAPGAADDALVVGFGIGTSAPISSSFREQFGARARRTTAEAAVLPIKPAASFRLGLGRDGASTLRSSLLRPSGAARVGLVRFAGLKRTD